MKRNLTPKLFFAIAALACLGSLSSCYKDYFDTNKYTTADYQPGIAVPLVHSTLTIDQIAPNGLGSVVNIANDFFVTLIYESTRTSPTANEMFRFADQNFSDNVTVNGSEASQLNGGSPVTKNVTGNSVIVPFSPSNNEQVIGITFSAGSLKVTLTNSTTAKAQVTFKLPTFIKGGQFSQSINVNANSTVVSTFDLTDYVATLSQFNTIDYDYTAAFTNGSGGTSGGDGVQVSANISGVSFAKLSGKLGTRTIDIMTDTTFITLFNNTDIPGNLNSQFNILLPELKVTLGSDMKLPATTQANQMYGSSYNLPAINLFAPSLFALLNYPNPNVAGEFNVSPPFVADINNSNIKTIVDAKRNYLVTDFDATINPLGGNAINEVLGNGTFSVKKELSLPLRGLAFDFTIQDTLDFSFGQDIDKVQEALFRVAIINGFPVEGNIQLFFTDDSYNILDSLIYFQDQKVIAAAPTDENGKSIGKTPKTTDILVDGPRMALLKTGTQIIIRARIASANNGAKPVKIYSSDEIDIKLGMQMKLAVGQL